MVHCVPVQDLFATPGMVLMTSIVCAVQVISLLFMGSLLYKYRFMHIRRIKLLEAFNNGRHDAQHHVFERRVLMTAYATLTILITAGTLALFIFQPHLLSV